MWFLRLFYSVVGFYVGVVCVLVVVEAFENARKVDK